MNAGRGERKPLVTVEHQTETDIATGRRERRMFVKMYFDAVDDGLLREMSPRLWRGLCCVARYVDEEGAVRVSQERIADDLGLSREHAHKLLRDLAAFRRPSTGEPVFELTRQGGLGGSGKKFRANVYRLYPVAGFQFGRGEGAPAENQPTSVRPFGHTESADPSTKSVRPKGHTESAVPCDPRGHTVPCDPRGHTYKRVQIQDHTHPGVCVEGDDSGGAQTSVGKGLENARELVAAFQKAFGQPEGRGATKRELEAASAVLEANPHEVCEYLIRFAVTAAERTKFSPRYFQAIVPYLAEAKAEFERSHKRLAATEARRAAAGIREQEEARAWAARAPEERARELLETKRKFAALTRKAFSPEEEESLYAELLAEQLARDAERGPKARAAAAG